MKNKSLLILSSAILLFLMFWWLFNLGIPEAALPFAVGITLIIMSGLLSGGYVSRLWFKLDRRSTKILMGTLVLLIIAGSVSIGMLVNRMMGDTEFFHFFLAVILFYFVSAGVGAVIQLVRNGIRMSLQAAKTAMIHSRSELQLLQSQLSPHFLFNTLNNLYGLSLINHPKVPQLLLKLSELLRYSVYETKELFVPLKQEVDYINNYIEFEKIRLGERLHLESNLEGITDRSWEIAPMLLIVFVENSFKHAKNSRGAKVNIDISLNVEHQRLQFSIKNARNSSVSDDKARDRHGGFGLENVKKRLQLLYEDKHKLNICETEGSFEVNLILER